MLELKVLSLQMHNYLIMMVIFYFVINGNKALFTLNIFRKKKWQVVGKSCQFCFLDFKVEKIVPEIPPVIIKPAQIFTVLSRAKR